MSVDQILVLDDLGDGMNGIDPPSSARFPMSQAVQITNLTLITGGVGRRRNGSTSLLPTHSGSVPFNSIYALVRDNTSESAPIIWAADSGPAVKWLDPATGVWTLPSIPVAPVTSSLYEFNGVSFNGKVFFAYRHTGAVDRLATYDPLLTKIRYVSLSAPAAAPTVANTGAGAYAATLRYYRQRYLQKNGSTVVRMSEPSASVSFTPSGAGTAARITKAATVSEDETHWMIEASADNISFFELTTLAVGTTTYDDSAAVSSYANGTLAKILGTCTSLPNAKYVITDGNRLIFANWVEQGLGSRVGWTPVFGSQSVGDDERMFQTVTIRPYQDLNPKNGGDITGLEQIDGVLYVFKAKQIWRGTPTEDLARPYIWRRLTSKIGCVFSKSLTVGEDATGSPVLYFMSHRGPYRVGPMGLEYLGRDIESALLRNDGSPNIAMTANIIAHSVYYDDVAQWWIWWSAGSTGHSPASVPNRLYVLHVKRATRKDAYGVRGGWVQYDGNIASAYASVLGPRSGYNGRPWMSYIAGAGAAALYGCDTEGAVYDDATPYAVSVLTRSLVPLGRRVHIGDVIVQGRMTASADSATLSLSAVRDRDTVTGISVGSFSLSGITPSIQTVEGLTAVDARVLQLVLADDGVGTKQWEVESVYVPLYLDSELA